MGLHLTKLNCFKIPTHHHHADDNGLAKEYTTLKQQISNQFSTPKKKNETRRRKSASSFREFIKDMNHYVRNLDSPNLRTFLSLTHTLLYFLIVQTKRFI
jgi:hypothetical protein